MTIVHEPVNLIHFHSYNFCFCFCFFLFKLQMTFFFKEFLSFLLLLHSSTASYHLDVIYVRQPEEHAYFKLTDETGFNEWSTYVHMNRSANLKEDEILKMIQPLYDGSPKTLRFQSSSITRHIGVQFKYILTKFNIESMRFENLCSQMKPKFSKLLLASSPAQRPSKLTFVVHHPTASFTLPDGFRSGCGRDELILDAGDKSILSVENFEFDSVINTKRLIVRQGTVFHQGGLDGDQIRRIRAEHLQLEGRHRINDEDLHKIGNEWKNGERSIERWEIQLDNSDLQNPGSLIFEKGDEALKFELLHDKLIIVKHSK